MAALYSEWINKLLYIHAVKHYLAIKGMNFIHASTWMNLQGIMPSEKKPVSKVKHCVIPLMVALSQRQNYVDRSVVARDRGAGGVTVKG